MNKQSVDKVLAQAGRIDALVNNAGYAHIGPLHWGTFSAIPLVFNMPGAPEQIESLVKRTQSQAQVKVLREGASLEI